MNPIKSLLARSAAALFLLALPQLASAWSDHALCTWPALAPLGDLAGRSVNAESFDHFLATEADALPALLAGEEEWVRGAIAFYPKRPDALSFTVPNEADAGGLRERFLRAIRVNPAMKLSLFRQNYPGRPAGPAAMPWSEVSLLQSAVAGSENDFTRLEEGAGITIGDLLASAVNEPDYGLDIGLWSDNHTAQSEIYGFGPQPFGNPAVDYGSQAPFHMGFYHEPSLLYKLAPFLGHALPEMRIHQMLSLAQFAFEQGHPYWGWRFTGWAIHYVQDLSQPYHTSPLPGSGLAVMIGINALDMAGLHGPKNDAITLVTNRHSVLEAYVEQRLRRALARGDGSETLLAALGDASDDPKFSRFTLPAVRQTITAEAHLAADPVDAGLARAFPVALVADPSHGVEHLENIDLDGAAQAYAPLERANLTLLLAARLHQTGRDMRAVIRAVAPVTAASGG